MKLSYHIYNSLNSESLMTIVLPFDYKRAIHGFYSNLWRDFKIACASSYKIDKRFVMVNLLRDKKSRNDNRMVLIFPNGIKFNAPMDLSETDFKIINLHLQAVELSLKP